MSDSYYDEAPCYEVYIQNKQASTEVQKNQKVDRFKVFPSKKNFTHMDEKEELMELKSKGSTFSGNLYELREEDQTTSQWESEYHQSLWVKAISPYHSRFRKHQLELVSGWRQPCAMLSSDLLVSNMFGFGSQTLRTIQWFSDMEWWCLVFALFWSLLSLT